MATRKKQRGDGGVGILIALAVLLVISGANHWIEKATLSATAIPQTPEEYDRFYHPENFPKPPHEQERPAQQ